MDIEAPARNRCDCRRTLQEHPKLATRTIIVIIILFVILVVADLMILIQYAVHNNTNNNNGDHGNTGNMQNTDGGGGGEPIPYKLNDSATQLLSVRLARLLASHVLKTHEKQPGKDAKTSKKQA
jgi:hypothetical protein